MFKKYQRILNKFVSFCVKCMVAGIKKCYFKFKFKISLIDVVRERIYQSVAIRRNLV